MATGHSRFSSAECGGLRSVSLATSRSWYLTGNIKFAILECRIRWLAEYLTGKRAFGMLGRRVRLLAVKSE